MADLNEQSRDDEDTFSEAGTPANLLGELNKSVSRLRELSTAEYGDSSAVNLEHTLDAILNMAQKSTFDDTTSLESSLRVAKPVQKKTRPDNGKEGSRACRMRLLLCGWNDKKDNENFLPDVISLPSKLGERPEGIFWGGTPKRQNSRVSQVEQRDCDESNGCSTSSKKNLVVRVGRKHADDVSSLSSDLFATRSATKSETRAMVVPSGSSPNARWLAPYEDMLSCRTPHRQLPIDEGHISFLDMLTCQRTGLVNRERLCSDTDLLYDNDIKIVGVGKRADDASTRSGSMSTLRSKTSTQRRKSSSKISRMKPEYAPKQRADLAPRSERATIYIYNQARKAKI